MDKAPEDVIRTLAAALHDAALDLTDVHFGSDGLLLFGKDGRVGTVTWPAASKLFIQALSENPNG